MTLPEEAGAVPEEGKSLRVTTDPAIADKSEGVGWGGRGGCGVGRRAGFGVGWVLGGCEVWGVGCGVGLVWGWVCAENIFLCTKLSRTAGIICFCVLNFRAQRG